MVEPRSDGSICRCADQHYWSTATDRFGCAFNLVWPLSSTRSGRLKIAVAPVVDLWEVVDQVLQMGSIVMVAVEVLYLSMPKVWQKPWLAKKIETELLRLDPSSPCRG